MHTKEDILKHLSNHEIEHTLYDHEPLFTCEQAKEIVSKMNMPGMGIKNLFLKDKTNKLYLITATDNTRIDLKTVGITLQAKELRFADANLMMQHLGVTPGSVTPLALINDIQQTVQPIIDAKIFEQEYIQIHPMQNDASIVITPIGLKNFFESIEKTYVTYDFEIHKIKQVR